MKKIGFYVWLITLLLSGCMATGSKFSGLASAPEQSSILYLFRESKFFNSAYCPAMFLDGKEIGCLRNGGFIRVELSPGKHYLEVRKSAFIAGDEPKIEFSSNAGDAVFVEWTTNLRDAMVAPVVYISASEYLIQVSETQAIEKLKNLKES